MDTIFGIIYAIITTLMVFVAGLSLALAWEMWRERKNKERKTNNYGKESNTARG